MAEEITQIKSNEASISKTDPKVAEKKQKYLDKLIKTYDKIFQMELIEDSPVNLVATAHYMEYAKKAFMRAERHEYVFIFDIENLTKDAFETIREFSLNQGLEKIKPTKGYLSSFITTVILAANMEENVKPLIEYHRHMQNLKKQKRGYVNQRVCAVNFSADQVTCNKDSKELGIFLQNFSPDEEEN